jgi:hypothetical protein
VNYTYNPDDMMRNWSTARAVLYQNRAELRKNDWCYREMRKYDAHPAVLAALKTARPHNWQQILLEWPHPSLNDASRVAYTRDERSGEEDRQTVTSIGKYLRRHWSSDALPDNIIRDLVARYGTNAQYKIVRTTAEMIHHLHQGPGSCMVWSREGNRCSDGQVRHPYQAYDPKYGWAMAVGILNGDTISRALIIDTPDAKYFVRTYLKPTNDGYSQVDGGMENWLAEQGFEKRYAWTDGQKMAYYPTSEHFLAPYLDGCDKRVVLNTINFDTAVLVIDSDGNYLLNRTDGTPDYEDDEDEDTFNCEYCGERTNNDDGYWVTRQEDEHVCQSCCDNEYTYVYGRRGNQYYVGNDYAVYCNNDYYDEDYLEDNGIVQLKNREYEHTDNAVEINGDWYHIDDERICLAEDTEEYALREDCWQCAESCNWYTDDCDEWTEYAGERYHDDCIPARVQAALAADAAADKEEETRGECIWTPYLRDANGVNQPVTETEGE